MNDKYISYLDKFKWDHSQYSHTEIIKNNYSPESKNIFLPFRGY